MNSKALQRTVHNDVRDGVSIDIDAHEMLFVDCCHQKQMKLNTKINENEINKIYQRENVCSFRFVSFENAKNKAK